MYYALWDGESEEGERARFSGSESRNKERGKDTKKERDNSTCSRTGLSLIFEPPNRGIRRGMNEKKGAVCAGGRNSRGNEQLRRWWWWWWWRRRRKRRRKKSEALVWCAGAISVNHRIITAPIIRYRDRSAEREEAGVSRSDPGNLLAATIRRRGPVYIRARHSWRTDHGYVGLDRSKRLVTARRKCQLLGVCCNIRPVN